SGIVCAVSDTSWQETTLTWATRPAYGTCLSTLETVPPNSEVDWDVTSLLPSGNAGSLALVSTDSDGAHFLSKESGGVTGGPRLYVELAPDAGSVDADAGSPRPDGGHAVDGGSAIDGGRASDGGSVNTIDARAACGCAI